MQGKIKEGAKGDVLFKREHKKGQCQIERTGGFPGKRGTMTNEEMNQVIRDVQEKCTRGMKTFKRPAFAGMDKIYIAHIKNNKRNNLKIAVKQKGEIR